MKKSIILIALAVMALSIVPDIQAQTQDDYMRIGAIYAQLIEDINRQMEPIANQMIQLSEDYNAGRITLADYNTRQRELGNEQRDLMRQMNELTNEQNAAMQQASQGLPTPTQAQLDRLVELHDQYNYLVAKQNFGQLSEAEVRRGTAIVQEIEQIQAPFLDNMAAVRLLSTVEKRVEELWPGSIKGWPPNEGAFPNDNRDRSYLVVGGLSRPIRQPPNTRASYTCRRDDGIWNAQISSYGIYLTGTGATQAAMEDLKRQIEAATGRTMERTENGYRLEFINPNNSNRCRHNIYFLNARLFYTIND